MPAVFISYRTSDEPTAAVLLKHYLSARFGPDRVFLAPTAIQPGADFERALLTAVRRSDLLLAVVGRHWLVPALDDPRDWVRREIAEAFAAGVTVVPVLVGDVPRLTRARLPKDIAALAVAQDLRLRVDDADADLARIGDSIAGGPRRPANPQASMTAHVTGSGRVYQAGGDQVIHG